MKYLDFNNYREFKIEDLFEVLKGRNKLSKSDLNENGKTPLYSSTEENNGILGYTNKKPDYKIDNKNIFYVIFGDHTRTMFVAKKDFCVMDNVKVLMPKIYNENAIKFILTVWKSNIPNLGYSRHWSVAKNIKIKLPVDQSGQLDLYYMEDYMNNIENKVKKSLHKFLDLTNNFNKVKIDTNNWVDFLVSDVFETNKTGKNINVPTGANVNKKDLIKGTTPRISVTGINNGVLGYFKDLPNNSNYRLHENFISVSFLGTVFYQKEKASIEMKVHCLKPIKHVLNKQTGQFLASSIIASLKNASYTDQISSTLLSTLKIKLPVDTKGEPDWEYMEQYIKHLENKLKNKTSNLNLF